MIDKPITESYGTKYREIFNSQFSISILTSYFPDLTDRQKEQYAALYDLYTDWNAKINVISRKDIENLYPHHVLHSLVSPICCVSSRVPR